MMHTCQHTNAYPQICTYTFTYLHTTHTKNYNVNSHSQMLTHTLSLSNSTSLSLSFAHVSALENGQLRKIGIAFFGAIKFRDISNFFRKKTVDSEIEMLLGRHRKIISVLEWTVFEPDETFSQKVLNYVLKVWGINYQQRPVASGLGTKEKTTFKTFRCKDLRCQKNNWQGARIGFYFFSYEICS